MDSMSLYNEVLHFGAVFGDDAYYNYPEADKALAAFGVSSRFIPCGNVAIDAMVAALKVPIYYDVDSESLAAGGAYTDQEERSIHLPYPQAFRSPALYQHVLLHELSHWVGNKVGRNWVRDAELALIFYGEEALTQVRAQEEFTAELTAYFVEQSLQIDSALYVKSYLHAWINNAKQAHGNAESLWRNAFVGANKAAETLLALAKS